MTPKQMQPVPCFRLPDNFVWPMFTKIYTSLLRMGLFLEFGAVKFIVPPSLLNNFLPSSSEHFMQLLREGVKVGKQRADDPNGSFIHSKRLTVKAVRDEAGNEIPGHYDLEWIGEDIEIDRVLDSAQFDQLVQHDKVREREQEFWKEMERCAQTGDVIHYSSDVDGEIVPHVAIGELLSLTASTFGNIRGLSWSNLYFGGFGSMFGWHNEDNDVPAMNLLLYGRKHWYTINAAQMAGFKAYLRKKFLQSHAKFGQPLRQKTFIIHPQQLLNAGFQLYDTVQNPGELVVSMPGAAHSGFNYMWSLAQAWNFAIPCCFPFMFDSLRSHDGQSVTLRPRKLLKAYLARKRGKGQAFVKRWMEHQVMPDELYYEPGYVPARSEDPRPMLPDERRVVLKLDSQKAHYERLSIFLNTRSEVENGDLAPEEAHQRFTNLLCEFCPSGISYSLERAEAVSLKRLKEEGGLSSRGKQRTEDFVGLLHLPVGVKYRGRYYTYAGVSRGEQPRSAYYRCVNQNCKPGCEANLIVCTQLDEQGLRVRREPDHNE